MGNKGRFPVSFEGITIGKPAERILVSTCCNQGLIIDLDREWAGKTEWPIRVWAQEFKRKNFGVQVLEVQYDRELFGYPVAGRANEIIAFWAHEISFRSVLIPKLVVNPAFRRRGVASAILQHQLYKMRSDQGPSGEKINGHKQICLMIPYSDAVFGPLAESLGFSRSQVGTEHDPDFTGRHENAADEKCRFMAQTLGVPDYGVISDRIKNQIKRAT